MANLTDKLHHQATKWSWRWRKIWRNSAAEYCWFRYSFLSRILKRRTNVCDKCWMTFIQTFYHRCLPFNWLFTFKVPAITRHCEEAWLILQPHFKWMKRRNKKFISDFEVKLELHFWFCFLYFRSKSRFRYRRIRSDWSIALTRKTRMVFSTGHLHLPSFALQ